MVDIYTVGPGDDVEKNGKPIVDKLVAARNEERIRRLSSNQLDDVFKFAKDNERFVAARKAIDKYAGSYDSGSVDEKGNTLSIDEKIEKVNKGDEFPYNIPIIGWICQKIEIAILKSKKNKIKEEILNKIENRSLSAQDKMALGEANLQTLSNDKNLRNDIRNDIAKDEKKNNEIIGQYGQIVGAALNYADKIGIINNEQKDKMVGELSKNNVNLSTDKMLTEDQWKKLEQLVERHKKEVQSKSKSTNVGREQEQLVVKPDPAAIAANKEQNIQQTQAVAQASKAKAQQVQTVQAPVKEGTGMQITGASTVQNGAIINSGAQSRGTVQSQGQGNVIG